MVCDYSFLEKWETKSPYEPIRWGGTRCSKGTGLYNYYYDTDTSEDTTRTIPVSYNNRDLYPSSSSCKLITKKNIYWPIHKYETLSEYITPWIKCIRDNQTITTGIDYVSNNKYVWIPPSREEKLRAQIQANLRPHLLRATRTDSDHTALMSQNNDIAEQRARLLLRDMIGEEAFRQYLKRGFITCLGPSGIRYRVTGGHNRIVAYVKNAEGRYVPFEELCIVVTEPMPFTDWVIWRKLMCEGDEFALRKIANITKLAQPNPAIYAETPARAIA